MRKSSCSTSPRGKGSGAGRHLCSVTWQHSLPLAVSLPLDAEGRLYCCRVRTRPNESILWGGHL